jgi:hypothetical protein
MLNAPILFSVDQNYTMAQKMPLKVGVFIPLIQSAKMNGHDPYLYLKDILERLPTHKNHLIHELLPHNWKPQ